MVDQTALKPTFFSKIPTIQKKPFASIAALTEEEKQLANMAHSAGWKVLKAFIVSISHDLDVLTENAIATSTDYGEIGQKAVVASLAKGLLNQVVIKVEDAEEAQKKDGAK